MGICGVLGKKRMHHIDSKALSLRGGILVPVVAIVYWRYVACQMWISGYDLCGGKK